MKPMRRKLTDSEIEYYENWAKEKEKGPMSAEEKIIVTHISNYSKNDWKGMRLSDAEKLAEVEDIKKRFEQLKQRGV